jgi:hypothetical protein
MDTFTVYERGPDGMVSVSDQVELMDMAELEALLFQEEPEEKEKSDTNVAETIQRIADNDPSYTGLCREEEGGDADECVPGSAATGGRGFTTVPARASLTPHMSPLIPNREDLVGDLNMAGLGNAGAIAVAKAVRKNTHLRGLRCV